jgi:hypothetical protein
MGRSLGDWLLFQIANMGDNLKIAMAFGSDAVNLHDQIQTVHPSILF